MRPLVKYLLTNSAVLRQATTSIKSVSFSPLWDLKSRSTAREKDVTAVPLPVRRSSGSRVRRPMMMILLSISMPPYSPLQTIRERMMPSVIRRTRSSSFGKEGSLVKVIRT